MTIDFMEVTFIDGSKYCFKIETLKSFRIWELIKIYLDDRPFELRKTIKNYN
jgi:hypothetical protein